TSSEGCARRRSQTLVPRRSFCGGYSAPSPTLSREWTWTPCRTRSWSACMPASSGSLRCLEGVAGLAYELARRARARLGLERLSRVAAHGPLHVPFSCHSVCNTACEATMRGDRQLAKLALAETKGLCAAPRSKPRRRGWVTPAKFGVLIA